MIVVSNTSPITNLAAIGQFALLHSLYGEVSIPDAVWTELNANGRHCLAVPKLPTLRGWNGVQSTIGT